MGFFDDFNVDEAAEAAENKDFTPIPAGDYMLVGTEFEEGIETKNGGIYHKIVFEVTDSEYQGRKIFQNFNWVNSNQKAQEIGRGQLASLAKALGLETFSSLADLCYKPVLAKVKVGKPNNGYAASNEASYFKAASKQPAPVAQAADASAGKFSM